MQQQGEDGVRDKTAPTPSPESDHDAALAEAGRVGLGPGVTEFLIPQREQEMKKF